ncbi:exported hypothetical protein [uncultured spirochete]|uniref:Uncharacterized protein n=1 Tax=uncultured spirochete TaxID=156406 RepID=A0A3P3XN34_9SPIR|nr:exported hypothetical protein [uncultured spirochete]
MTVFWARRFSIGVIASLAHAEEIQVIRLEVTNFQMRQFPQMILVDIEMLGILF